MGLSSTKFAKRTSEISDSPIRAVRKRATELESEGRQIFHLELGEPDFTTPDPIIDAAIDSLKQGEHPLHRQSRNTRLACSHRVRAQDTTWDLLRPRQ